MSILEGGAAQAGAVLLVHQKPTAADKMTPMAPSSPITDGAMPHGAETPNPVWACGSAESSCSHVFLGELPGEKLSYIMICVFPPYYKEGAYHGTQVQISCTLGA